jgi:hypothetical protein
MKVPGDIRDDVLLLLIRAAQKERTVGYGPIMRACGIPRGQAVDNGKAIGNIVGVISEWTFERWGVYLSSIVVHKDTGYPGGGFFGLPGMPSRFRRDSSRWTDQALSADEKAFIDKRQEDVFKWAKGSGLSVTISAPNKRKAASV